MNIKQKATELKDKVIFKTKQVYQWCKDNPEMAVTIGGAILAGGKFCIKSAVRHKSIKDQENVKNLYCYDRSLGHYWKLRRELRNDEWIEIDRRKMQGERLSDILYSMRVLD